MIGMALVMLLTRRKRFLTLLIPGLVWAFAHSSYLTDPIWLRGVELTIATLLLYGLFFLKFDLVTTIAAHYFYNALLTSLPLLRSGNGYFVVSGLVVVLLVVLPVIPGAARRLRRRKRLSLPAPVVLPGSPADQEAALRIGAPLAALNDSDAGLFCLRAGSQVVGYALGRMAQGIGVVEGLYVAPAYRRRYHGSDLYAALADWFQEQGAERVSVTVSARDAIAAAFWDAQGLRLEKRGYGAALRVTNG
jgi:GNAT superfamily N-acetyltransferase